MGTIQNGRRFSSEFAKATEVNEQTRVLIQTADNPVQYGELSQFKEVINNGMASKEELNQATEGINNNLQENYALTTGRYPKLTAGFAENLVGDGSAEQQEFSFRPTAGVNRNVKNDGAARMKNVKGNSLVLNMMLPVLNENNFIQNNKRVNFTAVNNECVGVFATSGLGYVGYKGIYLSVSDFYFISFQVESEKPATVKIGTYAIQNYSAIHSGGKMTYSTIYHNTRESSSTILYGIVPDDSWVAGDTVVFSKMECVNLTKMFRAGNEPTTIEEFWQQLPKGVDLNAYNAGTIIDGNYKAIKTTGFNQFNGTYAKVCAGCPYYLGGSYTSLGFATEEGGTTDEITLPTSTESVGTTPADRLYTPTHNGYIYAEGTNICINLSWDTEYGYMNGMYAPFKPFTRDLSWLSEYFDGGIMRSAGSTRDEVRFNATLQRWEAVQRVDVRPFAEGDDADNTVTTDGTNTNYALATPIITEITDNINLDYDCSDYGTEELIVEEGKQSAPLVADIVYEPNALAVIKQVPDILDRLTALESQLLALATMTTNNEEIE